MRAVSFCRWKIVFDLENLCKQRLFYQLLWAFDSRGLVFASCCSVFTPWLLQRVSLGPQKTFTSIYTSLGLFFLLLTHTLTHSSLARSCWQEQFTERDAQAWEGAFIGKGRINLSREALQPHQSEMSWRFTSFSGSESGKVLNSTLLQLQKSSRTEMILKNLILDHCMTSASGRRWRISKYKTPSKLPAVVVLTLSQMHLCRGWPVLVDFWLVQARL